MKNHRELFIFIFVLCGLIALAVSTSSGQPWSVAQAQGGTVPPGGGDGLPPPEGFPCLDALAFHSTRDSNLEIYIMNGDGSGLSRLTFINPVDEHPAPSPDGRLIAFDSTRDQTNSQIYVMNVDGSNVRRLTFSNFVDRTPHWSLDAQRIEFESNRDGSFQIWTMNFDGSDVRQLTKSGPGMGENTRAQWSKDNSRIAFTSTRDGHDEVYVMNATDGSNQTRLTNTPGNKNSAHPSWNRLNTRLAFESDRTGNYEIFTMNADGTNVKQITKTDVPLPVKQNRFPYWVPSCDDRIVFSSDRLEEDFPNFRIWVMDPEGISQRRLRYERPGLLVNKNAPDEHAAWSGAPVLPLPLPPTPTPTPTATATGTRVGQLLPKQNATPEAALVVARTTSNVSESPAAPTNTAPASDPNPGFWSWLTSLWHSLTGK